jgi:hypothetical protein
MPSPQTRRNGCIPGLFKTIFMNVSWMFEMDARADRAAPVASTREESQSVSPEKRDVR